MRIDKHVYVMHPETGPHLLAPGVVPDWAEPLITNPSLLKGESDVRIEADPEPAPPAREPETVAPADSEEVQIPPKAGRGSSAEAWANYAKSKGFDVEDDAKASEIREALEAEGIPTE